MVTKDEKQDIELKTCLNCGKQIPIGDMWLYQYKRRKFCSHSCAASYNNQRFKRSDKNTKEPFCLNCHKPLVASQTKYCSHQCQSEYQQKQWEEKWLSGEISGFYETNRWGDVPDRIRNYLFKKYNSQCAKCGWGEINPYTGKIPLEVEHIDGNYKNNRPENLTLLCPNCHSLTKTYRGANHGHGRGKTWKPIPEEDVA